MTLEYQKKHKFIHDFRISGKRPKDIHDFRISGKTHKDKNSTCTFAFVLHFLYILISFVYCSSGILRLYTEDMLGYTFVSV